MGGKEKKTILVVDDSPDNIDVLSGALGGDYRVRAALNGEKALAIAMTEPYPDLILLDIMMPGMDGYEVCRRLKQDARVRDVPVVFVTARGEVEDEATGFAAGAVDYITKPISPAILKVRVRTHLELAEARHHLAELVAVRTEELRRANARLFRQVKELHGRDRLIRFQMQGPSLSDACKEIGHIVGEVLDADLTGIFRVDGMGNLVAEAAVPGTGSGQAGEQADSLPMSIPEAALILARQAVTEQRVVRGEAGETAVPVVFNQETLGAIWVQGLGAEMEQQGEGVAVLTRLSSEAALVLRAARVADDLVNDKIDLDQLLRMGQ